MIPTAHAQEPFDTIAQNVRRDFKPNCPGYKWTLDTDGYKNAILRDYQKMLCSAGITDPEALKLLSAQLAQENGAFTADRMGDSGCSFGLIQYNACSRHGMKAKRFLEKNPEWKDYRYQLEWMVEQVTWRLKTYSTIKLAVVAHNCPACALRGSDSKAGYFLAVSRRAKEFTSL